ncbi:3906_t:CDS:2, partial [Dentiscutata erythropus]
DFYDGDYQDLKPDSNIGLHNAAPLWVPPSPLIHIKTTPASPGSLILTILGVLSGSR